MIVKTVVTEENLTLSEVKEIFLELTTPRSEEEFTYEFRRAFDHVKTFSKLTGSQARELVNELKNLEAFDHVKTFSKLTGSQARELVNELKNLEKMKEEIAIRIADIMPLSKDEVRSIYAKERFSLTEGELDEILDIVARFS